jgi:hypothetical protein
MRKNALEKSAIEHVHLAECVLDKRFPNWRSRQKKRGGSKPTEIMFQGNKEFFQSEKEAYIWLMEHFIQHNPRPFQQIDWSTKFIAKGPRAIYFAKSLKDLFSTSPEHEFDANKYHQFTNGWYGKLVLNEEQKIDLLMKFAAVSHLEMGNDWDWNDQVKNASSLVINFDN